MQNDHRLQSIATLEESDEVDGIVVVSSLAADSRLAQEKEGLTAVVARRRKPVLFYSYPLPSEAARATLHQIGVPLYTGLRGPALALSALYAHETARRERLRPHAPSNVTPDRDAVAALLDAAEAALCEYEAQAVLQHYGIATPPSRLVTSAEDAVMAAAAIGYPVALKIQSPDIPHKTEVGGVALDLHDAASVTAAYQTMVGRIAAEQKRARLHGVLVQKMAPRGGLEIIAGTIDDANFGPVLTVGLGGIHVEVLRDAAATPLPVDATIADGLLDRLRGAALLGPLRGAPARDRAALTALLARLAALAGDFTGRIASIDLNPILLYSEGLAVVDALILQHASKET
jgi:acyl-CoA synthetase (NDP forming)